MVEVEVKVKLTHPDAKIPEYKHPGDSGMDIRSVEKIMINHCQSIGVHTGVCVELPEGYELQARPRSGLARKGIVAEFGTIDSGYRGELIATLTNHSMIPFTVEKGDRIAQLVLQPTYKAKMTQVDELSDSVRGEGGFGSTGMK
jgi:dUTP pyrophosphatase